MRPRSGFPSLIAAVGLASRRVSSLLIPYSMAVLFCLMMVPDVDAQFGAFITPGTTGSVENIHLGIGLNSPMPFVRESRSFLVEWEGGYLSNFRGFPNGSAIFSVHPVYYPIGVSEENAWWPRLSGGVAAAPVLERGFRTGYFWSVGIEKWSGDPIPGIGYKDWLAIEFRDFMFRIGDRYRHYYGIRLSAWTWD